MEREPPTEINCSLLNITLAYIRFGDAVMPDTFLF